MNIAQYPKAIANVQQKILLLNQEILQLEEVLETITGDIDLKIAFDNNLKNEGQRKVTKTKLLSTNHDYNKWHIMLTHTTQEREQLKIQLQLLINEFSVAKLLQSQAISTMQIAETITLNGH